MLGPQAESLFPVNPSIDARPRDRGDLVPFPHEGSEVR
jgi:hypothetical protein